MKHQEWANLPTPTCLPGKVVVLMRGRCGRSGNQAGPLPASSSREPEERGMRRSTNERQTQHEPVDCTQAKLTDLEIALPRSLRRFATVVRASVLGPADAPIVVVLGGIS